MITLQLERALNTNIYILFEMTSSVFDRSMYSYSADSKISGLVFDYVSAHFLHKEKK